MARRIALVIHSLVGGGAERIAATMANGWVKRGNHVTLITLGSAMDDVYPVDAKVERLSLGLTKHSGSPFSALTNNFQRLTKLRRAIEQSRPQHVVSLIDKMNILTLLACCKLGLHVIVCERIDPRYHRIGMIWSILRRLTYPHCRALTVQTESVACYVRRFVGKRPVFVVPNPILIDDAPASAAHQDETDDAARYVVAMGRLVPQKGFDLLVEAFAAVAKRHPQWHLRILGEGPQRAYLERMIVEKGVEGRVEFVGWVAEPCAVLRRSHLFVLSSRYEGFPMALLEAMACGLPVISFDCPSGPADMLRPGVDGILVPSANVVAMSAAIERLISNPTERQQFGKNAQEVRQRFSQELFFRRWEAILDGVSEDTFAALSQT